MAHALAALLLISVPAAAVETRTWQHSSQADFEKGTLKQLSLRSDGRLFLAPAAREISDASQPYFWALAVDGKGSLYAGGGGPGSKARLYRVEPDGQARVISEWEEMQVQALATSPDGRIYAATSPDGKVYRVDPDGKPEAFYDPKAKYIWGLAFNRQGELFVATGDRGEVHKVAANGSGSVFFRTEESHARSIAVNEQGHVIVGTDPGGVVIRISPSGEGFVVYQSEKREITAVAAAANGTIYAAGVGIKQPGVTAPVGPQPVQPAPAAPQPAPAPGQPPATPTQRTAAPPPTLAVQLPALAGGSEVYRIDADGYPQKVWSHAQEVVYTLAVDAQGRGLVGTGNRGNLYRLEPGNLTTLLLSLPATQVTAIAVGSSGKLHAATGNLGKIYDLGPELEAKGEYESEVLDAGGFSYWGRLSLLADGDVSRVNVETRSGNLDRPQQNWSAWQSAEWQRTEGRVVSPAARFLQYRLRLESPQKGAPTQVKGVTAAYLPRNVAPVVNEIEATPPNYRFPPPSLSITPTQNITLQPLGVRRTAPPKPIAPSPQSMQYAKGYVGARWLASDENGDELAYKVEIRGEQETEWKLLKDTQKEAYLSWDSTSYADGEYRLRVTASDDPDNPPHQTLRAERISEPFLIDNSAPEIRGLAAARTPDAKLRVEWKAVDARSVIQRAEYSLDGSPWRVVEPVTRLSDARELDYVLVLEGIASGEHTVAIRVTDEFGNQNVGKVIVKFEAAR